MNILFVYQVLKFTIRSILPKIYLKEMKYSASGSILKFCNFFVRLLPILSMQPLPIQNETLLKMDYTLLLLDVSFFMIYLLSEKLFRKFISDLYFTSLRY